jgi:hypothetical protein
VLEQLYEHHLERCRAPIATREETAKPNVVDKAVLSVPEPKRVRNPVHLQFIGSLPALCVAAYQAMPITGQQGQRRMTIPLCVTHHRALHNVGSEEAWWAERGIDAKAEAERLWQESQWAQLQVTRRSGAQLNDSRRTEIRSARLHRNS